MYCRANDFRIRLRRDIKQALQKPTTGVMEYQANLWGTGFRWVRVHYTSLADNSGKVYRMVGTVSEVQTDKDHSEL